MGIFDNLFGSKRGGTALSEAEAFAGIMLAAATCDRHLADEEAVTLAATVRRMTLFAGVTDAQWRSMANNLTRILRREGLDALLAQCAAGLPDDLRESAFANAADLVLADGIVEDEEKEFLDKLQQALGIDGDTALTVAEVMIIKNRG